MFLISPNSYSPFTAVGQCGRNQRKLCATLEPSTHLRTFRAFMHCQRPGRTEKIALPSHWTEPQEQPLGKWQYRDSCNCYCAMALFSRLPSHINTAIPAGKMTTMGAQSNHQPRVPKVWWTDESGRHIIPHPKFELVVYGCFHKTWWVPEPIEKQVKRDVSTGG